MAKTAVIVFPFFSANWLNEEFAVRVMQYSFTIYLRRNQGTHEEILRKLNCLNFVLQNQLASEDLWI